MHKSFFALFAISLVGVLAASIFQSNEGSLQWLGAAFGLWPLLVYHGILYKKKVLSTSEIDSIYYFGFLVTVITLVATAIAIGLSPKLPRLQWILLQFGMGLVATAYALFARLILLTKSSTQAEMTAVEAAQKLVASVEKVAGEFDLAGHQVSAFVLQTEKRLEELRQSSEDSFIAVRTSYETALNLSIEKFTEASASLLGTSLDRCASSIDQATSKFSQAISLVIDEVARVQSEAEAISFSRAADRIQTFSGVMESSIESISAKVVEAASESATAIAGLTSTTRKVQKLATDISLKLANLDNVKMLVETIGSTTEALAGVTKTALNTNDALASLSAQAGEAENRVSDEIIKPLTSLGLASAMNLASRELPDATSKLTESLTSLGSQAALMAVILSRSKSGLEKSIASATTSLGAVDQRLAPLDGLLVDARSSITDLNVSVVDFNKSLAASAESISRVPAAGNGGVSEAAPTSLENKP